MDFLLNEALSYSGLSERGWMVKHSEVERAMGIEPTALAWEARVLPLYDARSWAGGCILSAAAVLFNPRSTRDTVPRGTEAAPFRTPR